MKDRAYAKINLALDVFNVRDDGYHDIKSIMIPINFYDELEIRVVDVDEYICNKPYIKFNEKNSIIKMIDIVKDKYYINDHFYINLRKSIPTQAGLGGGTSDAGSALRILKKLYRLDLSKQEERDICVAVGADVLFNYYNKAAVVEGIGDIITPIEVKKKYHVLLVKPFKGVSTKQAYDNLNMDICDHPNIDILKKSLEEGTCIDGLMSNSLEQPSLLLNKDVKIIKDLLIDNGCKNVLMSGSGSCVFAISEDEEEIKRLNEQVKNSKYFTRLTSTL